MFLPSPSILLFLLIAFPSLGVGKEPDLYARLGVKKNASMKEIKAAYRQKARDTHPDKQRSKDPEVAAREFREIVDAYETLSDEESRRTYDRTGRTGGSSDGFGGGGGGRGQQQWGWQWGGGFGFNFNYQRPKTKSGGKIHHFFFDHYRQKEIKDAWNRVLNIRNLKHLQSVLYADAFDEDEGDASAHTTERYCILAFYDPTSQACVDRMQYEILYPWPFAGNSAEGSSEAMWWEEIMAVGKVDVTTPEGRKLAEAFGVTFNYRGKMDESRCPLLSLIPRHASLEGRLPPASFFADSDEYRNWVWKQLKMTVDFINTTPWTVHYWWLDGYRGMRQPDIEPGNSTRVNTFISHSFFFRAGHVTGNTLTNESALLWYTARIKDDLTTIEIKNRCFDDSGECNRWRQEGFCDRNSRTFYTMHNPGHYDYVLRACPVSCKFGCGKPPGEGGGGGGSRADMSGGVGQDL